MFYERGRAVLTMILKAIEIIIICVVVFALGIKKIKFRLRLKGITDPDEQKKIVAGENYLYWVHDFVF